MDTEGIGECFDRCACSQLKRRRPSPTALRGVSRVLFDLLVEQGIHGKTVLEPGSGFGGLSRSLVDAGASRADGYDLSGVAVAEAERLSREAGTADHTSFRLGDGATEPLEPHDVVVLDKVICCYPDWEGLVRNSLSAAGELYAFSVPISEGMLGTMTRVAVAVENLFWRLRGRSFRAFVHDLRRIHARIEAEGFRHVARRRRLAWDVLVYVRPANA